MRQSRWSALENPGAKGSFMITPAILITSLGLVVSVADTVPRYDVRSTCRAAVALAGGSEGRTVENCMATEDTARKDLEKDWAKTPTPERTQCVGTVAVGGSPSYVELLICLEMMRRLTQASGRRAGGKDAETRRQDLIGVNSGAPFCEMRTSVSTLSILGKC